ncbi:MAG: alpha-galactosidase, partial [Thermoguttaceae bacterium]|nr:alpha-galactosidase [Thermoguttaceae bacterium]
MSPFVGAAVLIFGSWLVELGQGNQLRMTFPDQGIAITGTIHVDAYDADQNGGWTVVPARDGVADRLAIVDPRGDAQLYILFLAEGDSLEMRVEHRTRQFFPGTVSFDGTITFPENSWTCKTTPPVSERVLPFVWGQADSTLNDSIFAPEEDLALTILGSDVRLRSEPGICAEEGTSEKTYRLSFSGAIDNPASSVWCFSLRRHYFQSRWVPYYAPLDRRRVPRAPTGWMSWNTYFDKATAEDNLAEARLGKEYFQPFGMEFWSIESWQGNSDQLPVSHFSNMNLETNERQFPLGMKQLADDIRALGFRPGLWMAPFGTGNQQFYEEHKDWFLHDAEGNAISSWNGRWSLDPTVPEALDHLREIFRIASRQWGYEFFKIDGMSGPSIGYMAHLYERPDVRARFHDPTVPNPFERTVAAFREGIGEDRVFLACQGHLTGPEARWADAARIGADIVGANQPVHWEG